MLIHLLIFFAMLLWSYGSQSMSQLSEGVHFIYTNYLILKYFLELRFAASFITYKRCVEQCPSAWFDSPRALMNAHSFTLHSFALLFYCMPTKIN